jgi:mannosyl-oligosaccharide alpha-1,3-glucosidase
MLRPFVLTRSSFLGSQKYGALWTGDTHVSKTEIPMFMQMALSFGLAGMTFVGTDIPGFDGDPTDDMFIESYMAGVFYPFMRAHANINLEGRREPWTRSPEVYKAVQKAIRQRYSYSHYLYTAFKHATETGCPIIRPMWFEFPQEEASFIVDTQFMFAENILVSPKIIPTADLESQPVFVSLYLPRETMWYTLNGEVLERQAHYV